MQEQQLIETGGCSIQYTCSAVTATTLLGLHGTEYASRAHVKRFKFSNCVPTAITAHGCENILPSLAMVAGHQRSGAAAASARTKPSMQLSCHCSKLHPRKAVCTVQRDIAGPILQFSGRFVTYQKIKINNDFQCTFLFPDASTKCYESPTPDT